MKRLFALALCFLMIFQVTSISAFANEDNVDTTSIDGESVDNNIDNLPIPGADAPVSPTDASTHVDVDITDFLTEQEIAKASLLPRSTEVSFSQLLTFANQYVGLPYVWGGRDPSQGGFDCAGLVMYTYNHVAGTKFDLWYTNAAMLFTNHCTEVSEAQARPGDLVFFRGTYNHIDYISHVGIYCGNGITLNAGDPIGYDCIYDFKNMNGQPAKYFFARVNGVTLMSGEDGWMKVLNKWYYLENGAFKTGWMQINGVNYYFKTNGQMATGWQSIQGNWYYFNDSGAMEKDTWIGDYYVDSNGVWLSNRQLYQLIQMDDGWKCQCNKDGTFVKSAWKKINNVWYYFNALEYMVTGLNTIDSYTYLNYS